MHNQFSFGSAQVVIAQKIKEQVQPESRLHVYQHVVGVMYQHTELNARTVPRRVLCCHCLFWFSHGAQIPIDRDNYESDEGGQE